MPNKALAAFENLRDSLDKSPGNQALKEALSTMLKRHGKL